MLTDMQRMEYRHTIAPSLYDGGWRPKDRDQMMKEYDLCDEAADIIIDEMTDIMMCDLADEIDTMYDQDAFGSLCPNNWEEIGAYLREELTRRVDKFIRKHGSVNIDDLYEINHDLWDDYCSEKLPNCPETIF